MLGWLRQAGVIVSGCLLVTGGVSCKKTAKAPLICADGIDEDGDGFGVGCSAGADCNDFDASLTDNCNCDDGNFEGCPCEGTATEACFEGPSEKLGVGPCAGGTRTCVGGSWGACEGQVPPVAERCNELDDDCDGTVDNGVLSACGNCVPGCSDIDFGGDDGDPIPSDDDNPNVDTDGVGIDDDGNVVLDTSNFENGFLWVANDPGSGASRGTVSKIDTRTGLEVGRYATVVLDDRLIDHSAGRVPAAYNTATTRPSRTAVDFRGDVWVANRAHGNPAGQPSITKIFNESDDCVDRNNNGKIDTSADVDQDGAIDVDDPAEFFGTNDECIAMTVSVGSGTGNARAIAISAPAFPGHPGNAWVGMYSERAFYEIDGQTGALVQRVPETGAVSSPNVNPYGAAIDSQGRLWARGLGGDSLLMVNTGENPATYANFDLPGVAGGYGIAVDLQDRVWIAHTGAGLLKRYTPGNNPPTTGVTDDFDVSEGIEDTRTRGVGIDARGNVWASCDRGTHRMIRVNPADGSVVASYPLANNPGPIGIGTDFDGNVWTVNRGRSTASRLYFDPATGEPATHPATGNQMDTFAAGVGPYTYSDFTGLSARVVTNPSGTYAIPLQGCEERDSTWHQISWEATVPPETSLEVFVRAGDNLATLADAPAFGPWTVSPANLLEAPGPVPESMYLLLEFHLSTEGEASPAISGFDAQWSCVAPPIE